MRRSYLFAVLLFLFAVSILQPAFACETCGGKPKPKTAVLVTGLGKHHHQVSTQNPTAQKFFDQGLSFHFAFNHAEAIRSFNRAAELDPGLAMAHWGIALAEGSNYNWEADPEQRGRAYAALRKAQSLAGKASAPERSYIVALGKRYSSDPKADPKKLALAWKNAMHEVYQRYPDDLDAATLYAESAMNLRPWQLWGLDGKPAEGTEEITGVLESVLKRDPDHIGANHLYIHAVEASPHPERAIPAANRLTRAAPASGHLVHMPAHIYMRIGAYAAAANSNRVAAEVDRAYIKANPDQQFYPMLYYSHNLHFLAVAHAAQGRYADAKKAADLLSAHVQPFVAQMPMAEFFAPTSILVHTRFRKWNEILRLPAPDPKLLCTTALWRFARAMALASTGKAAEAKQEQELFTSAVQAVPTDATWDQNVAANVFKIASHVLDAKMAMTEKDSISAIASLKKAIAIEDTMNYSEPAGWYLPARENLGGVLLALGRPAEAEKVFRADLEKNARNPRSLFGLSQALKAQGNAYAAALIHRQFSIAWKSADVSLKAADL